MNNISLVKQKITKAAARGGRDEKDIMLLAVSKTRSLAEIDQAYAAGIDNFGENTVQELMKKQPHRPDYKWHFIGHLQTNKVKYLYDKIVLLHSLDRPSLAKTLEKYLSEAGIFLPVLLQVNISGEESKYGLSPDKVASFLRSLAKYPHLLPRGLMTMAPYGAGEEELRQIFGALRQMRDELNSKKLCQETLTELSMGMSGDFEIAIEEGATIVRVGTAIFGPR